MEDYYENGQEQLLLELGQLVKPLQYLTENPSKIPRFLREFGWDIDRIPSFPIIELQSGLSSIGALIEELLSLVETPPETLLDLASALEISSNLFQAVEDIKNIADMPDVDMPETLKEQFTDLAKKISDFLLTGYLEHNSPKLYSIFLVLGLIDSHHLKAPVDHIGNGEDGWYLGYNNISEIKYDKISDIFDDPIQYLKDEFFPDSELLDTVEEVQEFSDKLFPRLELLFLNLGFEVSYGFDDDYETEIDLEVYKVLKRSFSISYSVTDEVKVGATFNYSPAGEDGYGLVIVPYGDWNFTKKLGKWIFQSTISASIDGFSINNSGINFPDTFDSVSLDFFGKISKDYEILNPQKRRLGSTTGTRLEMGSVSFEVLGQFDEGDLEYGVKLYLERFGLFVGGGEGDGFLNKIFKEPIEIDFDLIAGWSNKLGFYMEGSASLEVAIPVHKTVLGLKIETVFIVLTFKDGGLVAEISADTGIELGPFSASVSRLGLASNMQFERGNLGFMNADLKFKPPSGIGLSIDASAVKGGGYLFFNHEEQKYAGVAELSVKDKISLKVVGILTTKLPGKDDGYSLLLLVTAEFTPINLAFGFTLNGVGGLVAINRTMNLQALRDGVKNNSIDNVMFPDDPVANAPQIISDLETIFPIQEGRYAFGVMGLIGWGTPTLITMEIGLMLEVPKPVRLAILGVVKAIMPEVEEGKESLLQIQINFVGTIDFEAKYITFDASIFDSKFVKFTLSGDMAFRLKWGDEPNFLLSVGGFHPAFTPPPLDLPSMSRLTISLLGEEDPRLTLSTYFAITSNTVQFGALLDFYYSVTKNIEVLGNLGFDVLIQFSPFYLRADLYATLAVVYKKEAVMAVSLYGMLEGPAPWHAVGKAEFTFLKLKLKASFDKTFGEEENTELPDKEVAPLLIAEGSKSDNWEGVFPAASNLLVSLKKQEPVEGVILSHPNGSLRFSQKIVPLDTTINKFGKQEPADYKHFSVIIANEAGVDFDSNVTKEFFAPADFIELSDTQKLTRKSFEKMNSGVAVSGSDNYESSFYLGRSLEYEHVVYDNARQGEQLDNVLEAQVPFNAFSRNNASARSTFGSLKKPDSNFEPNKVHLSDDTYTIAELEGLSLYLGDEGEYSFGSEAEAYETLERIIEENPGLTDKIDVVPTYEFA